MGRDSIVYEALRGDQPHIWIMRPDGSGRRQLTGGDCASVSPAVAPAAGLIVFVSECASGSSLWSMDKNGANLRPVCVGVGIDSPACTPDGRWIFFTSTRDGKPSLWKVDRDRGLPVQVTDRLSRMPAVSPGGDRVAFYYWSERDDEPRRIVSLPVSGGDPTPLFDLEDGDVLKCLRWEPRGEALHLLLRRQGVTELWRRPLSSSDLVRTSSFHDDRTLSFDSLDAAHFVCARSEGWSDVLLVRTRS
jgi:Tol biopolymer transport system component